MESLDLNGLAKSLPVSNFEKAEKELLNNFKAAALSITTLYRSSRHASKRAYNAGYASACQDLMIMIQQGVSAGGIAPSIHNAHSGEMTVGRILDWIEARLEAVKSREEEEDEDEEREKERERTRVTPPSTRSDAHKHTHSFPSTSSQKQTQSSSTPDRPDDSPVRYQSSSNPGKRLIPHLSRHPPRSHRIPLSCQIMSICQTTHRPRHPL
ncbi:hypothetical protein L210DRAFT_3401498 [Boletus edulis BED1]|uniref:Uncharacterized protein n=1 Tax=Boletus edulis BED1 TaxID=1328754 RepID=A0AAD4BTT4_BOLED|nr:hypothetical protein L210DRAFT_3401498 [Boletus edulis BED1]